MAEDTTEAEAPQVILVADDDDSIRDLLIMLLQEAGYQTLSATDGRDAVELALQHQPDAAILDVMMPGLDGFAACRAIKADTRTADTPILLLTALAQTRSKVQGLDDGATDYITKPFENQELLARLRTALSHKNRRDALAAEALTDTLTGLINRRGLEQQLDQLLAHADRAQETLSILLFDADRFKGVNDSYGHETGDAVLAALADRAQETMRSQDVVGRFGGEEFLAVLPGAGRTAALTAAERLRANIADNTVETPTGPITITVSVGIATCHPGSEMDRADLVAAADQALYAAKNAGRNRVVHAEGQSTTPLSMPDPPDAARALFEALMLVNPTVAAYSQTVAHLTWQVATDLRLAPDERGRAASAGLLHAIGRLVDHSHGPDDHEATRQAGVALLRSIPPLSAIADLVEADGEWWDGTGHPAGLQGTDIPMGARILAAAIAYEGLRRAARAASDDTMRRRGDQEEIWGVAERFKHQAGTHLDPAVVDAVLRAAATE